MHVITIPQSNEWTGGITLQHTDDE